MKGFKRMLLAAAFVVAAAFTSITQAAEIKLAVTDLEGLEQVQREFGAFKDVLQKETGFDITFYPVSNRTAAVEALSAKKIDFVLTGPAEYVVFKKRSDAAPIVGFSRPDYFAGIIVLADSPYMRVKDLKGQKVAFGDVGSTSNHLAPMQALADLGIDPRVDIEALHVDRKVAWEGLKRGDVAAIGINYGKFLELRDKEADLPPGAFRVIARSPDLPNDMLLAGSHVSAETVETVRKAFVDASDALVAAILTGEDNQKYKGMKFLAGIEDKDYDYVRSMYATIGYPQYAEFVGD
ncbi:MAG: PhnD/SsuA/transferrin family substrate-binding protein [Alphaproteobacteria bacterium]